MNQEVKTMVLHLQNKRKRIRKSFSVSEETAKQWSEFASKFPERGELFDLALIHFMEEYEQGNIVIELDFGKEEEEDEFRGA